MKNTISIIALVIALINISLIIFASLYSKKEQHNPNIIGIIIKLIFTCSAIVVILEGIDLFL